MSNVVLDLLLMCASVDEDFLYTIHGEKLEGVLDDGCVGKRKQALLEQGVNKRLGRNTGAYMAVRFLLLAFPAKTVGIVVEMCRQ